MRETGGRFVGASVRRVEDPRLLTGQGRYVDDIVLPGMLHAAFVRSPLPHAELRAVRTDAARRHPGVVAVLTGADMEQIANPYIGVLAMPGSYEPSFYALATDRVRHVGDPVAMVVAESRRVAEDAAQLVDVDYEPLDAIATIGHALDPARPAIWPQAKGNVLTQFHTDHGPAAATFADADHVVTRRFRQHRQSNQPMETRGLVVEIDPTTTRATVHAATQSAHMLKWVLALLVPRRSMRDSLKELLRNRERPKAFARGAKAFVASRPELKTANKDAGPQMLKQMAGDPRRTMALQRSLLGLLAKGPEDRPEVKAPDIGGAFGTKGMVSREDVAVYAAATHLGRSIKWIEDRNEHLMGGGHARDEHMELSFALANDGRLLGMRGSLVIDGGAYPGVPFSSGMFAQLIRVMLPGPYRVPALGYDARIVASNKGTVVPYRGPWAIETWVRERLLDIAARELGMGRHEIRLRNLIGPEELPTKMVTGPSLDVRMSAKHTFAEAMRLADVEAWPEEQEAARAQGRFVGMGFATYIEAAPGPPDFNDAVMPGFGSVLSREPAYVALDADGTVSVYTQQVPHGQGHETTLAQVAADELGVPVEAVKVRYGDTSVTPFGIMGTGGSRSAAMAGGAVTFASRELRDRILDLAADLLEAAKDDLVIERGNVHVAGVPARGIGLDVVAAEAIRRAGDATTAAPGAPVPPPAGPGEAMRATEDYDGGPGGWAQATHVCWVEVDLTTGKVAITRYLVVEDCGELINPAIVDGQIRGGVAQGIGAVLHEKITYDETGQFRTGTFMDYLVPTAMEIPDIEIHHVFTPSDVEANYRGVGEGGMIAAPAALTSAIEDALAHLGVRITEQHLPPTRVLELAGVIPPE